MNKITRFTQTIVKKENSRFPEAMKPWRNSKHRDQEISSKGNDSANEKFKQYFIQVSPAVV